LVNFLGEFEDLVWTKITRKGARMLFVSDDVMEFHEAYKSKYSTGQVLMI
jgi:hypothetical protein